MYVIKLLPPLCISQADEDWTDERRQQYLLRPDVARPLSVDRNAWGDFGLLRLICFGDSSTWYCGGSRG
jgi:hypothetical protein